MPAGRSTALLAVLALCAACSTAPRTAKLRVLCWNIRHARGADGRVDLDRIARVIRAARADLVSLQEVDRGVRRSGRLDQPAELARRTDRVALFERNIEYQGGDYGNAILTRLPVRSHRNHALPALRPGEQRGALEVVVDTVAGPLRFVATHWDYRADDAERRACVDYVRDHFARDALPTIVAGDLNARARSGVIDRLAQSWTSAFPIGGEPTFPATAPDRQIDWIVFRPPGRVRVLSARVLDERAASDHRPLLVELELAPPPAERGEDPARSDDDQ